MIRAVVVVVVVISLLATEWHVMTGGGGAELEQLIGFDSAAGSVPASALTKTARVGTCMHATSKGQCGMAS